MIVEDAGLHEPVKLAQGFDHLFRLLGAGKRGEADNVDEEHGHALLLGLLQRVVLARQLDETGRSTRSSKDVH